MKLTVAEQVNYIYILKTLNNDTVDHGIFPLN